MAKQVSEVDSEPAEACYCASKQSLTAQAIQKTLPALKN